jgi:hypothetical protein
MKYPDLNKINKMILNTYHLNLLDATGIDIKNKKRTRETQDLLKIFCKFVKSKYPKMSTAAIGSFLNRDHATVLHAMKKHDDLIFTDQEFKNKRDGITVLFNKIILGQTPEVFKNRLIELIKNAPESTCKEWHEVICETDNIKLNSETIINE